MKVAHPMLRNRVRLTTLLFVANGLALLLGALMISQFFLIALLVLLVICGGYVLSLRCPNCGNRVIYNPVDFLGVKMWMYTPWVPERCSQCTYPLP